MSETVSYKMTNTPAVENLTAVLQRRQQDETPGGLRGWRFELVKSDLLRVGIRNNQVGSAYSPPTVITVLAGRHSREANL